MDSEMDINAVSVLSLLNQHSFDVSRSPSVEEPSIEHILEITDPASKMIFNYIMASKQHSSGGRSGIYENKEQQKEIRKIRNRQSAKESRERKKNYQDMLEATVRRLFKENNEMRKNEQLLQTEVNELKKEKEMLHSILLKLAGGETALNEHEEAEIQGTVETLTSSRDNTS